MAICAQDDEVDMVMVLQPTLVSAGPQPDCVIPVPVA